MVDDLTYAKITPLRDDAAGRIIDLLTGSNDGDDNIFQILDDVLIEAYTKGRNVRRRTTEAARRGR